MQQVDRKRDVSSRQRWLKGLLVGLLAIMVCVGLAPSLVSGQWPWDKPLRAPGLERLNALNESGAPLPNWTLKQHQIISVNGVDWSLSEYEPSAANDFTRLALLLRPQPWHDDQPTVEWVDLRGVQNWRVGLQVNLTLAADTAPATARYFQANTDQQTLVVLQWYAWPSGGHFSPGKWFWADQASQWRSGQRTPWVAVSVLLPIEPFGDIRAYEAAATELGGEIQRSLMAYFQTGEQTDAKKN